MTPDDKSESCQPGSGSNIIAAAYGLVLAFAVGVALFFWYTVASLAMRWSSKRLKMNPAMACLLMGQSRKACATH